jgi:hypothetical protein
MATLENVASPEAFLALIRAMDQQQLMAQQLVQKGAIDALEFLLHWEAGNAVAASMLADLYRGMTAIHEVVQERAFELVQFEEVH